MSTSDAPWREGSFFPFSGACDTMGRPGRKAGDTMIRHPNGEKTTIRLLTMSGLSEGARILDLGAGEGETVRLLRSRGLDAEGIDLQPGEDVLSGDMRSLPYHDGTFDAVIAECSLSVCGDTVRALKEAGRVLKRDGVLMVGDVYGRDLRTAPRLSLPRPATRAGWRRTAEGFRLLAWEDITPLWTEYLIHALFAGEDLGDCGFYSGRRGSKTGYFLAVWKRRRKR